MPYLRADNDCDSAFGDDPVIWADYMFAAAHPLAGAKRDAESASIVNDPPASTEAPERPSKRKAAVGPLDIQTQPNPNSVAVASLPDTCFETFCQACDWEPLSCTSPCARPCSGDECTPGDACWDPQCESSCSHTPVDPKSPVCDDNCVDPECTKLLETNDSCCCPERTDPSYPLQEDCHAAHTAPTADGTIYCYDNVACHFQEGVHNYNSVLSNYESYPCYSQTHGLLSPSYDQGTQTSSVATPALSAGNYTSLDSTFDDELSPVPHPFSSQATNCFLDIAAEHCHIPPEVCCHGDTRGCGEYPSAPQEDLDAWYQSTAQGDGLASSLVSFGLYPDQPTTAPSAARSTLENPVFGGDDYSWMLPESHFSMAPQMATSSAPKLPIANMQQGLATPLIGYASGTGPQHTGTESHVCKWKHAPGFLCLAAFDGAEPLHKHIKSVHVDSCTQCVCLWEGCESSSKDFKQRSKLSRHLLAHAGYRPYACSFEGCGKTFATNQAKDNHERTHTGDRPYVCDRCGYTTTTYTQLQTHISALHEGKKPHKCRFCDFSCADSSNLSKHERTHQTLRPYRCPQPNCTFKPDCRWENLKRHLRRSGHCPELLVDGSPEYKAYREGVQLEIKDWNERNKDGGMVKMSRRKGRGG